jgi:hypothetical protein
MQLKKLMIDSKSAWVSFPGLEGFEVEIVNLSKKELQALRKRCITQKFDKRTRQLREDIDEERFVSEFSRAVVKNWKGLTLENLESLLLIDMGDNDPSKELEYSIENSETLINSSNEFDTWLNEVVFDLDLFRTGREERTTKETGTVL